MSAFLDTNVVIRHLTGDPPDLAARATAALTAADELLFADLLRALEVYEVQCLDFAAAYFGRSS